MCIAVLAAMVLVPALLFPLPPLIDYPNHLARIWLIAGGVHVPPLDGIYFEDWRGVGAGIGIDAMAKLLSPILPPSGIGLVLLILAILAPPLGAISLNARMFGGVHAWQPYFLAFWCTQTLVGGFLNFQIGLGLALLAVAADPKAARAGPWALYGWRIASGAVLFIIHPFALFFFAILQAAITFGGDWPAWRDVPSRLSWAGATATVALMPPAIYLFYVQGIPGSEDRAGATALFNDWMGTVRAMASPFTSYDIVIDFLCVLPLAGLAIWALANHKFQAHKGLILAAAGLAAVALLMPHTFGRTGWIDKRFPLLALLTALSATRLTVDLKRQNWVLAGAVVLVALRTAWISLNWAAFTPLVESMRTALADVPAGARVLPMQHDNTSRFGLFHLLGRTTPNFDETFRHYPAMMIPWRHAFTPMMFAQYREKPILLRPAYVAIANPTGGVLYSVHALDHFEMLDPRTQFIRNWRQNFDYVLVLNADIPDRDGPFTPPPGLHLVNDTGFAQLYRVAKTGG
ncbi:hypothetical protein GCM10008942_05040 [Rhizomicrobium electricum]|uniref:Glycosyltransferase RgtA/B/C/D-like domain-containing protein n=1 Tax=Rhizomicrobium electricum TaxID=480070 RepID=A0ABN1E5H2_9PROT